LRGKSSNDDPPDDQEESLDTSTNSRTTSSSSSISSRSSKVIKSKEDWENWYPMEWLAWITYGVPSSEPSEHWVCENVSEGPKSAIEKRKPAGRVDQRKRETYLKTEVKTSTNVISLLSTNSLIAQSELAISSRQDDLQQINLIIQMARTPIEVVSNYFFAISLIELRTKFSIFI
jgi:hypothetical protein